MAPRPAEESEAGTGPVLGMADASMERRGTQAGARRRGRPPAFSRSALLESIRALAAAGEGLFQVHRSEPALYARARRAFGSWAGAVRAAGLDYADAIRRARRRSRLTIRGRNGPPPDESST